MKKIWTKEEILEGLKSNNSWVEKAVLAIFNKQTIEEQISDSTRKSNNMGYNSSDARLMSYYAKWIQSGKKLTGCHLEKARKKIYKYSGQLTKIANGEIWYVRYSCNQKSTPWRYYSC